MEYDPVKNAANHAKHGMDFAAMEAFDWDNARVTEDARLDYGEIRYLAKGMIRNRLHIAVFTLRGMQCRMISLRKANARERKSYAQES